MSKWPDLDPSPTGTDRPCRPSLARRSTPRSTGASPRCTTARPAGGGGGLTSATEPGPRSAKITATTARPGPTCPTTSPGARRIAGVRTGSPAGPTATSSSSSRRPSGTAATRSSRNASSAWPGPRGTTARTSRSITSTPTPRRRIRIFDSSTSTPRPSSLTHGSGSRTPVEGPPSPNSSCSTPGSSTTTATFDIEVEYAKVTMEDLAIKITATNRGPDPAPLHLIPHLWFRNTWAWGAKPGPSPKIYLGPTGEGTRRFGHRRLGWSRPSPPCP